VLRTSDRPSEHMIAYHICKMRLQSESARSVPTNRSCRLCDPVSGWCRAAGVSGDTVQSPDWHNGSSQHAISRTLSLRENPQPAVQCPCSSRGRDSLLSVVNGKCFK